MPNKHRYGRHSVAVSQSTEGNQVPSRQPVVKLLVATAETETSRTTPKKLPNEFRRGPFYQWGRAAREEDWQ
jgi:hypothetical protein